MVPDVECIASRPLFGSVPDMLYESTPNEFWSGSEAVMRAISLPTGMPSNTSTV